MQNTRKFYIDGEWVEPIGTDTLDVVNPATEKAIATIALGDEKDVDRAVTRALAPPPHAKPLPCEIWIAPCDTIVSLRYVDVARKMPPTFAVTSTAAA